MRSRHPPAHEAMPPAPRPGVTNLTVRAAGARNQEGHRGMPPPATERTHRCHSVRPSPRMEGAWFGKQTHDGAGGCCQAQASQARSAELSFHKHGRAHGGHAQGTQTCLGTEIRQESLGGLMVRLSYSHGHQSRLSSDLVGRGGHHPSAGRAGAEGSDQEWAAGARDSERTPQPPLGLSLQRGPAPGRKMQSLPPTFRYLSQELSRRRCGFHPCVCVCVCVSETKINGALQDQGLAISSPLRAFATSLI